MDTLAILVLVGTLDIVESPDIQVIVVSAVIRDIVEYLDIQETLA